MINLMKRPHERLAIIKNVHCATTRKPAFLEVDSMKCKGGTTGKLQKIVVSPHLDVNTLPLDTPVSIQMYEDQAIGVVCLPEREVDEDPKPNFSFR